MDIVAQLENKTSKNPIAQCINAYPNELNQVNKWTTELKRSLSDLRKDVTDVNELLKPLYSLTKAEIIRKLDTFHTSVRNLIETTIMGASDRLIYELSTNVFPCRGLYEIYIYAGSLLCKGIRYPNNGMWIAAVIVWVSLLTASVIFYMRANLVCHPLHSRHKMERIKKQTDDSSEIEDRTSENQ
ncbi:hypothetical protein DICVIV_05741 [Dictyocaulus viviparus]|uniref:Uncharacterized protein n=1 Tax=Dictyocaulus viviparus TaxID=29172 RepID=A0A0D8XWK2_DICVI|nr:hypothetical protein DICVIV_05741 [Dictyocaulus viviparus]